MKHTATRSFDLEVLKKKIDSVRVVQREVVDGLTLECCKGVLTSMSEVRIRHVSSREQASVVKLMARAIDMWRKKDKQGVG